MEDGQEQPSGVQKKQSGVNTRARTKGEKKDEPRQENKKTLARDQARSIHAPNESPRPVQERPHLPHLSVPKVNGQRGNKGQAPRCRISLQLKRRAPRITAQCACACV